MRLTALVLILCSTPMARAALKHGDKAPPLRITKWVRGESVGLDQVVGKKVVVVEFWATWCGPCIVSIPHLTEVQKKHAKDVVVVGVTRPDPNNSLEKVEKFVGARGEKMGYRVAFDGDGKTYEAYMRAAGQRGIPTAFIIDKTGRLAWIGHPMQMDEPLGQIVAGKFDIESEAAAHAMRMRVRELQLEFFSKVRQNDAGAASEAAKEILKLAKDDAGTLNTLSWTLLTHPALKGKFVKLALRAAKRCHEITSGENWMYLDTLALALFESGRRKQAVTHQRKAVELAEKAKASERSLAELKERLERFESAASEDKRVRL